MGHGDRYIGSLFRVDEPVPDDFGSLFRVDEPVPDDSFLLKNFNV